ncbi:hypothetical protein Scep_025961 [Stephania cephalantha]|uniref:Uncharacterized protein n=1 Tax=Stephania cephalantha TaxID=152367 RepID=A0AAP0EMG4_9MAGN
MCGVYGAKVSPTHRVTLVHYISTIRGLMADAVARDRVRDPVECTDRDIDLVMHRDKDMDMFHLDRYFNVSDVALTYIDGRRQMVCSLLGGLGGAQLVAEEPKFCREEPSPTE